MFWDRISGLYDFFEIVYNKEVYTKLGESISYYINFEDNVLECACGTGAITKNVAMKCNRIVATDLSSQMLKKAKNKCQYYDNVFFESADITNLKYENGKFDKVIAGNVIHLLDDPRKAVDELRRVCKRGGKIIIPTYINNSKNTSSLAVKFLELLGAKFNLQFNLTSYKEFYKKLGIDNVMYYVIDGRMPCAIAIISN